MNTDNKVPAIRFEGFSGEWEEKALREVAEFNPKSDLPEIFEYVDLESVAGTKMVSHRTESRATAPSRAQRVANKGDVFYQTVRPYQKNNYLFEKNSEDYVFSTGYAQMRPKGNGYFLLSLVQNEPFVKIVLDNCTGTSYPAINSTDLSNLEITCPEKDEQTKIGNYFQQLDTLITQHQQKHDKLLNIKKALLEKMFPEQGEDEPEIRFKGFSGMWEERELEDEVDFYSGLTYSPNYIVKDGGTLVLRSSNVKNGELVYGDNVFVDSSVVNSKNVNVGDIVTVVRNGSRSLIGKHAQIKVEMSETVIGAFMTGIHSNQSNFINALLNTTQFTKEIEKNLGATINQITTGAFKKMSFMFSESDEQQKIGELFKRLDTLLSHHQTQLNKLKNIKQACLEKMFV